MANAAIGCWLANCDDDDAGEDGSKGTGSAEEREDAIANNGGIGYSDEID